MNARGAIELAVPFYRQALALLLEERNQLRQLLPENERIAFQALSENDLVDLLQAADLLGTDRSDEADLQLGTIQGCSGSDLDIELDSCVAELAEDLTPISACQVIAGLDELLLRSPGQRTSAEWHSLRGKAFILIGDLVEALNCFELAYQANPAESKHVINFAGSLLSQSRSREALSLLRPLYASGVDALNAPEQHALFRNLSAAESQEGHLLAALQLRHEWLLSQPDAFGSEYWLELCREALCHADDHELYSAAVRFLRDLHRLKPESRPVAEALAQALESLGEYRQAALLYRHLLRS